MTQSMEKLLPLLCLLLGLASLGVVGYAQAAERTVVAAPILHQAVTSRHG